MKTVLSAGATALIYLGGFIDESTEEAHLEATHPLSSPDGKRRRRLKSSVSPPTVEKPTEVPDMTLPNETDTGHSPPPTRTRGRRGVAKTSASDSTLDEQVALYNKAKSALSSGQPGAALEPLDTLQKRYPKGPLSLESKELRAHVLARMGRYREASRTVTALISANVSTRKKAQLFRFLGDLQVKQNLCAKAVENYRLALGLGLTGAESNAAKAGIQKCLP